MKPSGGSIATRMDDVLEPYGIEKKNQCLWMPEKTDHSQGQDGMLPMETSA